MVELDRVFVLHSTKRTLDRLCVVKSYKWTVVVDNYVGRVGNTETDGKVAGCIKLTGEAPVVMASLIHDL
jgi:hypothetical protein